MQAIWQGSYVRNVYLRKSAYMKIHKTDEARGLPLLLRIHGTLQTEESTRLMQLTGYFPAAHPRDDYKRNHPKEAV